VTTMEKGGKLKAAKEIVAGGDLKEIIAAANRISAALVQLREEFETASRAYTPPV